MTEPGPRPTPSREGSALPGLLVILVVAIGCYAGALGHGFVYDDHRLVEQNPFLRDPGNLGEAFTRDLAGGTGWKIYRPLAAVSFMFDHATVGLRAGWLHAGNILWHVLGTIAMFSLARELVRLLWPPGPSGARYVSGLDLATRVGLLAATVFAVHPLQSEAVVWISRRPDLMAGAIILASLAAFARFRRTGEWRWAVGSVALAGVGLTAKEVGVITPPLLLLLAVLPAPGGARAGRAAAIGVALVACAWLPAYAHWRGVLFGSVTGQPVGFVQNWVVHLDGSSRAFTHLALVGHYLRLLLVPITLSADYSWRSLAPASSATEPMVILGALGVMGSVGLAIWGTRRHPFLAFALALEAIALVPVANLLTPIGATFAERFFYLPMAGVALSVAVLVEVLALRWRRYARPLALVGTVVLVLLAVRTTLRVRDWYDDEILFASVLRHYPDDVVARTYVAITARERGRTADAVEHYARALEVMPDYHLARVNLALIHLDRGDAAAAAREARYVVERDPGPGAARLTLARASLALGDTATAVDQLRYARRDPRTRVDALVVALEVAHARRDWMNFRVLLQEARRVAPDHPRVRQLGRVSVPR